MSPKFLINYVIIFYYLSNYFDLNIIITFGLIYVLGVILLIMKYPKLTINISLSSKYLLLYILFSIISSIWSENYLYTIFFSILNLGLFLNVYIISMHVKNIKTFFFNSLFLISILEIIIMFFRLYSTGLYSIFESFHGSASLQSAIALFIYPHLEKNKKPKIQYILFLIFVIISTSWKIYAGILAVLILRLKTWKKYVLSFLLLITSFLNIDYIVDIDYGKLEHLGGRLGPWIIMANKLYEKPVSGYGFPFGDKIYIDQNFTIENAHNVFLGSALYLGAIGLILMTLLFVQLFRESKDKYQREIYLLILISVMFNIGIAGKISGTLIAIYLFIGLNMNKKNKNELLQIRN